MDSITASITISRELADHLTRMSVLDGPTWEWLSEEDLEEVVDATATALNASTSRV